MSFKGPTHQLVRICVLALAIAVGTTFLPGNLSLSAPAAAVTVSGGSCANDTKSSIPPAGEKRCIAGTERTTRARIRAACLIDPAARIPGTIYDQQQCGGSGRARELIAQMRAIARLNETSPARSRTGISPDVQWEVQAAGYADIVEYNHTSSNPVVHVIEVKGTWEPSYPGVGRQLDGYINALGDRAVPGDAASLSGDTFRIRTNTYCKDGGKRIIETYATTPHPSLKGVLVVHKTQQTNCESDDTEPRQVPEEEPEDKPNGKGYPIVVPGSPDDTDDGPPFPDPTSELVDFHKWADELAGATSALCEWVCIDQDTITAMMSAYAGYQLWMIGNGIHIISGAGKIFVAGLAGSINDMMGAAGAIGDPHLRTLDGLGYDFQAQGEFDLLDVPDSDFTVQARFLPPSETSKVSLTKAVAVEANGHKVELKMGSTSVLINGESVAIEDGGYAYLGNSSAVIRNGSTFYVFAPGYTKRPVVRFQTATGAIGTYVPAGTPTAGLLGNNDGLRANDFKLRNGTQLSSNPTPTTIHTLFANSWRVDADSSLFTYAAGQGPETFADPTFPASALTLDDYSLSDQKAAEQSCREAGVVEGVAMSSCVFDLLALGEETYLHDAVAATAPAASPDDAYLTNGALNVDFEGDIPSTFRFRQVGDDSHTSHFAGPVADSDAYGFSVIDMDPHTATSVDFDLIVIGDWSRDTDQQKVTLTINDDKRWQTTIHGDSTTEAPQGQDLPSPSASGTLDSGKPYWIYPITASTTDRSAELRATIGFSDGNGSTHHTFGIDNLSIDADTVAPDVATLDMSDGSASVSNGDPESGMGNIEGAVSKDVYRFTVPAGGQSVVLNNKTCVSQPGFTYQQWKLLNSQDQTVRSGSCNTDPVFDDLPAGDYRLEVTADSGKTGTYTFDLFTVPDPQTFTVSTAVGSPAAVSNGVPSAGAGNLETIASKDRYKFTVPSGGQTIFLDNKTCVSQPGMAYSNWKLTGPGALSITGNCSSDKQFDNLPAGEYQLEFTTTQIGGTYSFDLFVVDPPQYFDATVTSTPFAVSNGVPGSGAGNLETKFSKDVYRFTVASGGQSVVLNNKTCVSQPGFTYQQWRLLNQQSQTVRSGSCNTDPQFDNLPAGDYRLEVTADSGKTGTYTFDLYTVPDPQAFNLTLSDTTPASVSNGVPATGAGNLETVASKDIYRFTVPTGGRNLLLDNKTCVSQPGMAYSSWALISSTGASLSTGSCSSDKQFDNLPAGEYQLEFTTTQIGGTYSFDLFVIDDPQSFDTTVTSTPFAVSNGVPGSGAGNLETKFSKDVYRFTVPAGGQSVVLNNKTCVSQPGFTYQQWKLLNSQDQTVRSGSCNTDPVFDDLPAGDYRLEVTADSGKTGTYTFDLFTVPDPQTFTVSTAVGSPAAVSNGVPSAGAGNLETIASKDRYKFTVPSGGQTIFLDNKTCVSQPGMAYSNWKLTGPGALSITGNCSSDKQFDNLPAGEYQLEFTTTQIGGTYSFDLFVVDPPQYFDATVTSTPFAVSNGVPGSGAGNLETKFSKDVYRFTVASGGQSVVLNNKTCVSQPGFTYQQWRLLNQQSQTVRSGSCNTDPQFDNLPAGDYRLEVTADSGKTGTYTFDLYTVP